LILKQHSNGFFLSLSNAGSSGCSDLITGAQDDKKNDPVEEEITL